MKFCYELIIIITISEIKWKLNHYNAISVFKINWKHNHFWEKKVEKTVSEEILHFYKVKLVSYVAIETVIIIVIGGFGAEFVMWLAHRTVW